MKLSIVLSTHAARFQAVAFKGDFEANVARIASYGYTGVELAIRDPLLVDAGELEAVLAHRGLEAPAIGTGQAWGEERLSFTSDDPAVQSITQNLVAEMLGLDKSMICRAVKKWREILQYDNHPAMKSQAMHLRHKTLARRQLDHK